MLIFYAIFNVQFNVWNIESRIITWIGPHNLASLLLAQFKQQIPVEFNTLIYTENVSVKYINLYNGIDLGMNG